jgi:hypothetical protein
MVDLSGPMLMPCGTLCSMSILSVLYPLCGFWLLAFVLGEWKSSGYFQSKLICIDTNLDDASIPSNGL